MQRYFTVRLKFPFFCPAETRKAVPDEQDVPIHYEDAVPMDIEAFFVVNLPRDRKFARQSTKVLRSVSAELAASATAVYQNLSLLSP